MDGQTHAHLWESVPTFSEHGTLGRWNRSQNSILKLSERETYHITRPWSVWTVCLSITNDLESQHCKNKFAVEACGCIKRYGNTDTVVHNHLQVKKPQQRRSPSPEDKTLSGDLEGEQSDPVASGSPLCCTSGKHLYHFPRNSCCFSHCTSSISAKIQEKHDMCEISSCHGDEYEAVFWDVAPCSLVKTDRRFRGVSLYVTFRFRGDWISAGVLNFFKLGGGGGHIHYFLPILGQPDYEKGQFTATHGSLLRMLPTSSANRFTY
jgi:hypothetical protein